jgi:hypothetical protein
LAVADDGAVAEAVVLGQYVLLAGAAEEAGVDGVEEPEKKQGDPGDPKREPLVLPVPAVVDLASALELTAANLRPLTTNENIKKKKIVY